MLPTGPFKAFLEALPQLERTGYVAQPSSIGKLAWWSLRRALLHLGLIDAAGQATDALRRLLDAPDEPEHKSRFRVLLIEAHPWSTAGELTDERIEREFSDLGLTGDVKRKAITFYRKAAGYAGIVIVSPRGLKRPTPAALAEEKVLNLECGGRIRIIHEFDYYTLSAKDQRLMGALLEIVRAHESGDSPPSMSNERPAR